MGILWKYFAVSLWLYVFEAFFLSFKQICFRTRGSKTSICRKRKGDAELFHVFVIKKNYPNKRPYRACAPYGIKTVHHVSVRSRVLSDLKKWKWSFCSYLQLVFLVRKQSCPLTNRSTVSKWRQRIGTFQLKTSSQLGSTSALSRHIVFLESA